MENFELVQHKLEAFIKKYYFNLILKGSLLFVGIGLLYFLLMVSLEYFLWLSTTWRTILFWLFIFVEISLLYKFVGLPLIKLLKISEGINEFQASEIIGNHFPEVNDKLKNLLQLRKNSEQSDLLLASINQRSKELTPIPFTRAIDIKKNRKYLSYVIFPFLIIIGLIVAGKANVITNGFTRISDYNKVYLKPAPFHFIIQNSKLTARQGEDFKLQIKTVGEYNPEIVSLISNGNENFMKQTAPGFFEYSFTNLNNDLEFQLYANEVSSENYLLDVIEVPKLLNFEMQLDYPAYTGLNDEKLSGTGNITIPEGTQVRWNLSTRNVNTINFKLPDTLIQVKTIENTANYTKTITSNLEYSVSTSNKLIKNYENLDYVVKVIKDQYPEITVVREIDSLNTDIQYFKGDVSDDYGLSRLELVYFSEENEKDPAKLNIPVSKESFDEFHFSFPGNIPLESGKSYTYYFRIYDNDAVNGAKSARSEIFSYRKKTDREMKDEKLKEQNDAIKNIGSRLEEFEKSEDELEEISRLEKEKESLNYNERKKLEEFLKRQKKQNEMMKNYSEKLEKSLEQNENEENSSMEKELSKRLENNQKRLEQNEALLEELEKYSEKIQKEDLGKKLENLSKQNKSNQRNLEQLLELTKRYYVEEKKQKLARDLEDISEEQEKISNSEEENTPERQEELNEDFEDFQEDMDGLEKENEALKEPQDLDREGEDEESIKKDQEDAKEQLEQNNKSGAKQKQKDAAKKMKEMSQQMQQSSAMQGQEQLEADTEMLRQILDNLIVFSFEQEDLLNSFKSIQQSNPNYASKLKEQSNLRENFRHVDDSLYVLAMRNPMINEVITDKLIDVEFDIEKSIERLSENEISQGTASQQYVVTGANDLANLLDQILGSMQQMMSNPQIGEGEGDNEFQLQDIIKKQKKLMEQMKQGTEDNPKPGQEGEKNPGEGETQSGELYEIYKEQQMLRMQMEEVMEKNGAKPGKDPADEMQKIEEQLLDKGFDPETLKRMQQLEYELMKFEEAFKLQGTDEKRKSESNRINYENSLQNQINSAKEYFNSTEILNRQILPLHQIYREKVKDYFGKGRD
ncbi:DUF4175 family protein [Christiangramia forsetii]|uniref:Uncharacterized protein n=2 Tax=Christiangramia forsetii TaxID=411153 RepID=A0M6J9_CHRFK|nr:DUF4175 family protein [Christiangramia forsetii]GGG30215.1 ATPase [Christiangramia forsetii]CAL68244.1 conserved hypothetical protein, membrane [Christiangramia forsetii KT0803]